MLVAWAVHPPSPPVGAAPLPCTLLNLPPGVEPDALNNLKSSTPSDFDAGTMTRTERWQ